MFTIIPVLYTIGVHYIQKWRASSVVCDMSIIVEQGKPCDKHEHTATIDNNLIQRTKTSKKKHDRRQQRRKTSISELSYDDINYLINETGFTRDEILLWYEDFLRDCPDGKLSKSKFINIYQQFYKTGRVEIFCEHAFRLFNKDGSGYMDFMEFLLAVSLTSSKDPKRKIELFFAMYDIDHNGLIDSNEMRSVIESIYQLMGVDITDPSRIDTKVYSLFSTAECDQLDYLGKEQFGKACENDRYLRKFLKPPTKSSNNY
ncbi:unnamed protein product [Adineta ricciae]|uniref:EF-hand domain-containing protein n=1 Tax=Adineta ricciae TaxID=249248 RepID=A0A815KU74_ADIRI|nr:unnamed protein product [Adineta ricciae]